MTGRLVRDPEVRETANGQTACRVRLAVDGMARGNTVGYMDVTEYGPPAAASARTLSRGWLVAATGRLEYREWERNGTKHSALGVVGRIEFLSAPRASEAKRPAAESAAEAELPAAAGF